MTTEATAGAHLSIGEVLDQLRSEFPDVTISKIRFLESQGLIDPERTPSGYRRFYPPDLQRLRWILLQQRDSFLPLRVIKERLDAFGPTGAPRIGSANGGAQSGGDAPVSSPPTTAVLAPRQDAPTSPAPNRPPPNRPPPTPTVPVPAQHAPTTTSAPPAAGSGRPQPTPSIVSPDAVPSTPRPPSAPAAPNPTSPPAGPSSAPRPQSHQTSSPVSAPPRPPAPPSPPAREPVADLDDAIDTEDDEDQVGSIHRGREAAASTDLTRGELLEATGLTDSQADALESFGILVALVDSDGRARYDDEMLAVAELAAGCYRRGIEARHLKMYWHFAEREAALFTQVLLPYVRQRNPASRAKLQGELEELARLGRRLRTAMLRRALRSSLTE